MKDFICVGGPETGNVYIRANDVVAFGSNQQNPTANRWIHTRDGGAYVTCSSIGEIKEQLCQNVLQQ